MSLYKKWLDTAYDKQGNVIGKVWNDYLIKEQKIYEYFLANKVNNMSGVLSELAEQFKMTPLYFCGFISGINEARVSPLTQDELDELTEESNIEFSFEFDVLYKKMVEYKAEKLYTLPEWDGIFDTETQKNLYWEQKKSTTLVRETKKVGRNEPCPCGSGMKFKQCCGKAI